MKYGGLRYLDAAHVKDFVALLRLADNPRDELAWFRVLQLLEGVGPGGRAPGGSGADAPCRARQLAAAARRGAPLPAARTSRPPARRALSPRRAAAPPAGGRAAARRAAPLLERGYADGRSGCSDVDPLLGAARVAARAEPLRRRARARAAGLDADLARPPQLDEDYLVLSTVHSAKGLEWEAVHVLARSDGTSRPTWRRQPRGDRGGAPAVLRRADPGPPVAHVYVPVRYYHRPRGRDDAHGIGKPSRFLTDAVRAACDVVHLHGAAHRRGGGDGARRIEVSVDALFS